MDESSSILSQSDEGDQAQSTQTTQNGPQDLAGTEEKKSLQTI